MYSSSQKNIFSGATGMGSLFSVEPSLKQKGCAYRVLMGAGGYWFKFLIQLTALLILIRAAKDYKIFGNHTF